MRKDIFIQLLHSSGDNQPHLMKGLTTLTSKVNPLYLEIVKDTRSQFCSVYGHCHGVMQISLSFLLGNDTIDGIMITDCFRWVGHMHKCVYCTGNYFGKDTFC